MVRILGIIWVLLGIIWAIKPAALRNYLKRKISRRMRWIIYGFLILFGLSMIGSVIKAPGTLSKIVGLIGVILVIKCILMMTSKASEKLWGWWLDRPLIVFRLQAVAIIVIGIIMISL